MSVQNKQASQIVSVKWQERARHFNIQLSGPLGLGAVRIKGRPGEVTLTRSNKKIHKAATAQALLVEATGWFLPVENLYYWIRSLPVPSQAYDQTLDEAGRLRILKQDGWEIHYLDYHKYANGVILPRKMLLLYPGMRIKLVISKFSFHM